MRTAKGTGVAAPYSAMAVVYDRLVGSAMWPSVRASFERCVRKRGVIFRSAADVGCGTGAFLRYLLRYRVPLYGVDRSPQMLRIAAARLPPGRVRLLRQDMRRLRLPRRVDLITCNGDTLNYLLTAEELGTALTAMARNLAPGGHLTGDLLLGRPEVQLAPPLRIPYPGGVSLWRRAADSRRRLTRVDVCVFKMTGRGVHQTCESHLQRWHVLGDLQAGLSSAGLRLRGLWRLDRGAPGGHAAWVRFLAHCCDEPSQIRVHPGRSFTYDVQGFHP